MDAAVGTNQKGHTYWARMNEYFDASNTSRIERTDRSFRSRCATISGNVKNGHLCLPKLRGLTQVVQMTKIRQYDMLLCL
jgi:hypothetical protein